MTSYNISALENRLARKQSRQAARAGRTDRRPHKVKLAIGAQLESEIRAACSHADPRTVTCIAAGLAEDLGERLASHPTLLDELHAKGQARLDRQSDSS